MLLIDTKSFDPYLNLATEEYFFKNFKEEIIFIYINSPSIILGKHQNAYEEINLEYVTENNLPVLRRISGGGTVYHDMGNLNFTFIRNREEGKQVSFIEHTRPIISFFEGYGLSPYLGDKNEIREDGLKFSGNAEHIFKNRVLHHGTILFDSELGNLGDALKRGRGKYKSRAVQSNRTRVGNLAPRIRNITEITQLRRELSNYLRDNMESVKYYKISDDDLAKIHEIVTNKYRQEDWNYAYGPDYSFRNSFYLDNVEIYIKIEVKKGLISTCTIEGDPAWERTATKLIGRPHTFTELSSLIAIDHPGVSKSIIFSFFN